MQLRKLLRKLRARIGEIENELAQGKGNLKVLSQELAVSKKKVEAIEEYLKLKQQLKEAKALLAGELKELAEKEVAELRKKLKEAKRKLLEALLHQPEDERNAILEIHAGTGGDEAELFAGELLRMYLRYAEKKGFRTKILEWQKTPLGGIKEAKVLIEGQGAYGIFKYEGGVHRVQRVPITEKK
ncbi:PCRF domain-containing protein, partial [bacterium]|nr:PCRF domain-containing protein [bacterium]